jgi:hypothetical protein
LMLQYWKLMRKNCTFRIPGIRTCFKKQ